MCHPRCGPCEATGELVTSKDGWAPDGFKKHIQGKKICFLSLQHVGSWYEAHHGANLLSVASNCVMWDERERLKVGRVKSARVGVKRVGGGMG